MKKLIRFLSLVLLSALGMIACASNAPAGTTAPKSGDGSASPSDTTGKSGGTTPADTSAPQTSSETETPEEDDPDCAPDEMPVSVEVGNVRVQLLSSSLVRIEVKGKSGYEDRPSFSVTGRTGWKKLSYDLAEEDGKTVITTRKYKVYLPKKPTGLTGIFVTDRDGRELWRYESKTSSNVFLPSPSDELASWYFTDSPRVIPSENGYSLPEDGDYVKNNGWTFEQNASDLFLFLPGGDYRTFASDFVKLTGRSEMLSLDLFGYWDSRYYVYSEKTALQQIREYKERGYSIDVLVIDTDWRDTSNGIGYTVNEKLFPNIARFLEEAHKEGVTVIFNDHPEPVKGTTGLLDEAEIEYRTKNLKLLLSLGLDYWWYDRNWTVALKPITDGISIYASGMFAFQWITEDYYSQIADDLQTYARRALIMGNVDGINNGVIAYAPELAAHRYTLQWTGDINTDAYSLDQEIRNMILGGVEMGLPYMSSDLGGHTSEVTNDMYVRWIQYGALSPICRVHCTKPYSRMPWLYGDLAEQVTKEYVGMRYRLLPLFYELAHENYVSGLPLIRRLDLNYPQYAEASANNEYLLGDYILVAPISGAKKEAAEPDVTLTHDGEPGLYAEYFDNRALRGDPVLTKVDDAINFDWTTKGPKELGIAENFSIRWTGEITVGSRPVILRFYADDGIRVWVDGKRVVNGWSVYDQYLFTSALKKGTHTIKVEYFQAGGLAHVNMSYIEDLDNGRTVFLPDGEWIDVWTGERVVGPTTVKVDHPLATSPIYIRSGAILTLAENMTETDEKNWSVLTLDVYPSKNYPASAVIYEDDARTVAYKDGKYRTTDFTMTYDDALTIGIGAAQGSFESDFRAFDKRTYNLRIHARDDFGAVTKITLDGKEIDAAKLDVDQSAAPFAFEGGARDSVIYEFSFETDVDTEHTVRVWFEHPVDDKTNDRYDRSAVNFDVSVTKLTKKALNLSENADLDWALFGYEAANSAVRKKDGAGIIGELGTNGVLDSFTDNYRISWTGGDRKDSGSSTNGPVSRRDFCITLKTTAGKTQFVLYVGGWKSLAKITVRDRAGNVKTLSFGDLTTNYYRKVVIECDSADASEVYVDYAILCGENVTFSAVQASDIQ